MLERHLLVAVANVISKSVIKQISPEVGLGFLPRRLDHDPDLGQHQELAVIGTRLPS